MVVSAVKSEVGGWAAKGEVDRVEGGVDMFVEFARGGHAGGADGLGEALESVICSICFETSRPALATKVIEGCVFVGGDYLRKCADALSNWELSPGLSSASHEESLMWYHVGELLRLVGGRDAEVKVSVSERSMPSVVFNAVSSLSAPPSLGSCPQAMSISRPIS